MAADDASFDQLIEYIKSSRGFDFTGYKRPSLERRFEKRMQAARVEGYDAYRGHLEANPAEFAELFNTILINVTTFFRDPQAWDYLREDVVPRILEEAKERESIRVWSAGCASGEEAYSLAIVFAEAMPESEFRDRLKIYATDVDEEALTDGRHALYAASHLENVPDDLRERYFDRVEQRYAVRPELRRAVIFGRHDAVHDPPISRIDLLSSRNMLIYFTKEAQSQILTNFHFALRDSGFLFLGKSELMLARARLFTPFDVKRRVFEKVPGAVGFRAGGAPKLEREAPADPGRVMREVGFETAPIAQIIVDRAGDLTLANVQARTLFDLDPSDLGRPFKDLKVSYNPVELRSQIERAYRERHVVHIRDAEWEHPPGEKHVVDVQLAPLLAADGSYVGVGISFVDVTRYKRLQQEVEVSKRDVEIAYEELQSTVEELETTNEELQSTNEELETTNEELQSTNEELETLNEEMQSTNEELETINDELGLRTDELAETNIFLESILRSLEAGVVVLDGELRVNAWNAAAAELWGLRADETEGQHLMNLDIGLPVDELRGPLRALLSGADTERVVVVDATNRRGRAIRCRVELSPLVGDGGPPRGVILFMEPAE
jgi:two-component system CheB/CheR fusion protein